MAVSVLTQDFRQQLEQQRDRLTQERDAIVQAAIDQATADLDRSLDHINGLLSSLPAPSSNGTNNDSIQTEPIEQDAPPATSKRTTQKQASQKGRKAAVKTAEPAPTKSPGRRKTAKADPAIITQSTSKTKAKTEKKAFEAPKLKREFKDLSPAKALEQVMMSAPEQMFTTDEMIDVLYGALDESVLPRTRQSIALMFSHGLRRQDYIKTQEDPAHYKLNPEREVSAS
jgi:hypothetical protein